ncbi:MAG: hypothetical protein Q9196_004171 [Gyalolechia fulgens]
MTQDLDLSVVDHSKTPPTISTDRLSWATSMFYFGMLVGLYPLTFLLQRFSMGRVLGGIVLLWGLVAMLTAAVTSWQGLFVQRFFLGFVESIVPTAFMCIIASYYTQKEQALRQSWWFSATGGWTIIGGALNYGFAQITGVLAGCVMIWKSTWYNHAPTPIVGYTLIGFFGPCVSLIISIGMANVAGATKKSFTAAAIFVAYCVGNIVGPQLIKTPTLNRHYPGLWLGLIIWENTRRDQLPQDEAERDAFAFRDLTDKENPYFRYVL